MSSQNAGLTAKHRLIIHIPLGLAVATALFVSGATAESPTLENQTLADAVVTEMAMEQEATETALAASDAAAKTGASVEAQVREYFKDIPILQEVAFCESTFHQFNADGSPLRGRANPADIGVMQINETVHLQTANRLGYDLATLEGNMGYARHLYEAKGTSPWVYSKPCWGDAVNQLAVNE